MRQRLKERLVHAFNEITIGTHPTSSERIVSIIMAEKGDLTVDDVSKIITEIGREHSWNDAQDDILIDISSRLGGFCPEFKVLKW